jgi:DNA-binding beta-propeller fold protein YncE
MTDYHDEATQLGGRIMIYDTGLRTWSQLWRSDHSVSGLAVSASGRRVVVAVIGADRVDVLDGNGNWLASTPQDPNQLQNPQGVALAPRRGFYVVDPSTCVCVHHYDRHAHEVDRFGSGNGSGIDQFTLPKGIASRGRFIYVVDSGNDRVVRWRRAPGRGEVGKLGGDPGSANAAP